MVYSCAVAECTNTKKVVREGKKVLIFHPIPKNPDLRAAWISKCNRKSVPHGGSICSEHFQPEDYERDLENELLGLPPRKRRRLKSTAIPSIFKEREVTPREERLKKRANIKTPPKPKVNLPTYCLICCGSQLSSFPPDFDREFFRDQFLPKFLFLDNNSEFSHIFQYSLFCGPCVGRLVEAMTTLKTIESLEKQVYGLRDEFDSNLRRGVQLSLANKDTYFEGRSKLAAALGIQNIEQVQVEDVKKEPLEYLEPVIDFLESPTATPAPSPAPTLPLNATFSQIASKLISKPLPTSENPIRLKKCKISLKRLDLPQGQVHFNAEEVKNLTLKRAPLKSQPPQPQIQPKLIEIKWDPTRLPICSCSICQKRFYGKLAAEKHKSYAHFGIGEEPYPSFEVGTVKFGLPIQSQFPQISNSSLISLIKPIISKPPMFIIKRAVYPSSSKGSSSSALSQSKPMPPQVIYTTTSCQSAGPKSKCLVCSEEFDYIHTLTLHLEAQHGNLKCGTCCKFMPSSRSLSKHELTHSKLAKKEKWDCPKCPLKYRSEEMLESHMDRYHKTEQTYLCSSCPKIFKNKRKFKDHELVHLNPREFKCHRCPKAYNFHYHLLAHLRSHDGVKSHMCHRCGKTFVHWRHLKQHLENTQCTENKSRGSRVKKALKSGTPRGEFPCPTCQHIARSEIGLKIHKLKHSSSASGSELKCPEPDCDRVYPNKIKLRAHIYALHPISKWFCQVCQKPLKNKQQFVYHERIHANLKEFACSICPGRFNTPNLLKIHELTHDKSRTPCICPKCGKGFVLQKYLSQHLANTKCADKNK